MSIFVSYRREGGSQVAQEIYHNLCEEYDIFLDTESLESGYFDDAIIEKINKCTDFILLVTEAVFDRCSNTNDWITNELRIAIKEKKNIIPIFVGIKNFPSNIPEELGVICRYNGIFWDNADLVINKLKERFLLSNKRQILWVKRVGKRVKISNNTMKELLTLCRRFQAQGRRPVDIEIRIENEEDFMQLFLDYFISQGYSDNLAMTLAKQYQKTRFLQSKKVLESAIEYMLQDEMLDSYDEEIKQIYIDKYSAKNCRYIDDNGIERFYWAPFIWFDIIEEMLKELVYDRVNTRINHKDYLPIDCYVRDKNRKEIWSFISFVKKRQTDNYMKMLQTFSFGHGDYLDIPKLDMFYQIYPDLYYNIGLLKEGKTRASFEEVNKYKNIFVLLYYRFGLH